jgi:hypothetical protein
MWVSLILSCTAKILFFFFKKTVFRFSNMEKQIIQSLLLNKTVYAYLMDNKRVTLSKNMLG